MPLTNLSWPAFCTSYYNNVLSLPLPLLPLPPSLLSSPSLPPSLPPPSLPHSPLPPSLPPPSLLPPSLPPSLSAQENYAQVKAKYGEASSYLLQINSCPGSPSSQHKSGPDIWSQYLRTTHLSSSTRGEVSKHTDSF